jgi:hypothetical protein
MDIAQNAPLYAHSCDRTTTMSIQVECGLVLLLDRVSLRHSRQPAAQPAVQFVTHGPARRRSLFALFLHLSLTESLAPVRESVKFMKRIAQSKHQIELDIDSMLFLIVDLRPRKAKSL